MDTLQMQERDTQIKQEHSDGEVLALLNSIHDSMFCLKASCEEGTRRRVLRIQPKQAKDGCIQEIMEFGSQATPGPQSQSIARQNFPVKAVAAWQFAATPWYQYALAKMATSDASVPVSRHGLGQSIRLFKGYTAQCLQRLPALFAAHLHCCLQQHGKAGLSMLIDSRMVWTVI